MYNKEEIMSTIVKFSCNEKRKALLKFLAKRHKQSLSGLCSDLIGAGIEQCISADDLLEFSNASCQRPLLLKDIFAEQVRQMKINRLAALKESCELLNKHLDKLLEDAK